MQSDNSLSASQEQSNYDETIMSELLKQQKVRNKVLKMTPDELKLFKELLVTTGIYTQYCLQRGKK